MATHAVPPVDAQLIPFQSLQVKHRASAVLACLLCADLLAATLARVPLLLSNDAHWNGGWQIRFLFSVCAFLSVLAFAGLYRQTGGNPAVELKRLVMAASFFYLWGELFPAIHYGEHLPSVLHLLTSWGLSVSLILLFRHLARRLFSSKPWWSVPAVVFYTGNETLLILKHLRQHPECGIRPAALLVPDEMLGSRLGLPTFSYGHAQHLRDAGITRALVVHENGSHGILESIEQFEHLFPRLLILNGLNHLYTLDVCAFEIGRSLAVEVRRKSLSFSAKTIKRLTELLLVSLVGPIVVPAVLVLMLLISLDSKGPVFFGHMRIGRDGRTFKAWKLRTMQVNSDELLQELLHSDGGAREEWHRDRKLRQDPRITRIGKLLRRASLDELPQLWNVIRGEMSLVGPRPIIQEEAALYGQRFPLYCRVTPGITGLWQVSGRSTTTASERVQLDAYYVRNWSPWLDLHILMRTAHAVLGGRGAY